MTLEVNGKESHEHKPIGERFPGLIRRPEGREYSFLDG